MHVALHVGMIYYTKVAQQTKQQKHINNNNKKTKNYCLMCQKDMNNK
jgi:hypothetical protein